MFAQLIASGAKGINPLGACANGDSPTYCHCFNGDIPIGGKCNAGSVQGPPP